MQLTIGRVQLKPSYKTRPGPAGCPGPGQLDGWTGSGLIKDRPGQQPGKTRSTRRVNP